MFRRTQSILFVIAISLFSFSLYADQLYFSSGESSSEQSGNGIANVIDGDPSTRWAASDSTYPQWAKLNLGTTRKVDSIVIAFYNPAKRYYTYNVQTSTNDITYTTTVPSTQSSTDTYTSNVINATTQYVLINFTGVTDISTGWLPWAGLVDVFVYGPAITAIAKAPGFSGAHQNAFHIRAIDNRTLAFTTTESLQYDLTIYSTSGQNIMHVQGNNPQRIVLPHSINLHQFIVGGTIGRSSVSQLILMAR